MSTSTSRLLDTTRMNDNSNEVDLLSDDSFLEGDVLSGP